MLVRDRKPDVSPNFHFMQQLQSFESQLQGSPCDSQAMDEGGSGNIIGPAAGCSTATTLAGNPSLVAVRCGRGSKFSCNCIAADCKCMQTGGFMAQLAKATGVSPDSGIEFDRWTPSSDTGLKWDQLGGKSFVLPPNQCQESPTTTAVAAAACTAATTSPPPIGLGSSNADNMSPASTTSSSTSTTTTAEAVSVVELVPGSVMDASCEDQQ